MYGFLSKSLTCIVNKSLTSGIVPQLWKKAIVTPLQKKRNAAGMTNYRPISVLPVLSKILERVVQLQLVDHFLHHNLISPFQSGFRPGYSTQDVLHCVIDSWLDELDKHRHVGAIFLDLAKAFDCVNHNLLLKKLSFYGLNKDLKVIKDNTSSSYKALIVTVVMPEDANRMCRSFSIVERSIYIH